MAMRSCRRLVATLAVLGLAVSGCSRSGLPATNAVKGKVIYKGGDIRVLAGGMVEFELVSDPTIAAGGEIEADGSFTLRTWSVDGRSSSEGAAAGEHRVRVEPPRPREEESKRLIDAKYRAFDSS